MIRISVMYLNEPGKNFDWDYYLNKHLPMVHRLLDPIGLVRTEWSEPLKLDTMG